MEKKELIISRAKRKNSELVGSERRLQSGKKIREESLRKIWREGTVKFQQDRELEIKERQAECKRKRECCLCFRGKYS